MFSSAPARRSSAQSGWATTAASVPTRWSCTTCRPARPSAASRRGSCASARPAWMQRAGPETHPVRIAWPRTYCNAGTMRRRASDRPDARRQAATIADIPPRAWRAIHRVTMKILALTNLYPNPLQPHRAAFNRHRFRFLAGLHEVRLIAPSGWRDERSVPGTGGAIARDRRTVSDGIPVEHPRYWYTPGVLRGLYGRFFRESVRRSFDRHVREFAPDMVFATCAYPDGWAAVRLARRHSLPVVLQVHGSDVRRVDEYAARREGTRAALSQADGVIAVSADLGRRV